MPLSPQAVAPLPCNKTGTNTRATPTVAPTTKNALTKPPSVTLITTANLLNRPTIVSAVVQSTQEIHHATLPSHLPTKGSASPSPNASPLSSPSPSPVPDDDKSVKRQRRLLKNRESAQLSRIRKKMYIEELERKVNALVNENSGLREEVVHLNDVLKQVANSDEDNKNAPQTEMLHSAMVSSSSSSSGSGGGSTSHQQAKRYAGVCLLVVLFSLGLFFNVVPSNNRTHSDSRLIELDNNNMHFRDYKITRSETTEATSSTNGRKEKSDKHEKKDRSYERPFSPRHDINDEICTKRAWEEEDDDGGDSCAPPSPKRIRTDEFHQYYSSPMDTDYTLHKRESEEEYNGDGDTLFDVLEDDAFSDDGILTTSSSSSVTSSLTSSPFSSPPSSPSMVPSTPPLSPPPATPIAQLLAPAQNAPSNFTSQAGLAVMVPSFPIAQNVFAATQSGTAQTTSEPAGQPVFSVLNVHIWPFLRTVM